MKARSGKRYNFIFRESANPVFFTDLLLKDYGVFDFIFICEKPSLEGFASEAEIEKTARIGLDLFSNAARIGELKKRFRENYTGYNKLLNDIDEVKEFSDKQINKIFSDFCLAAKNNVNTYFLTEPHFLVEVEKKISEFALQNCQEKTIANKYIIDLTTPFRADSLVNIEEMAWFDLVKKLRKTKSNGGEEIADHFKKFRFMFYKKKPDFLQKRLEETCQWDNARLGRLKEEVAAADRLIDKNQKEAAKILNPPSDILTLCESVRDTATLRLNLRFFMNNGAAGIIILKEIAKRNYLALNQVKNCTVSEVGGILENRPINLLEINERTRGFVAEKFKNKWTFYTGKRARQIAQRVRPVVDRNATFIQGNTASIGNITGRVRVVKNIDENLAEKIREMKEGEILVTEMTRPQLMGVCKKAAAIITDEGGINCHAAIISRELNVPCIIGTKVATQLLRDGDTVQINGDNGSVEIIKRFVS